MTYGYGEPGSPSPDGEPDEWQQGYRTPRPQRRDTYPPAPPPQGGTTYGNSPYGDQPYGAPASGPAYGAPASGPAYGGQARGGRDYRDPAYDNPAYGSADDRAYGNPPEGRRRPEPGPRGSARSAPGYEAPGYRPPDYQAPGYQAPGYRDNGYPQQGHAPAPGYSPSTYQASGYPPPPAPTRQDQSRPDSNWHDQGYPPAEYRPAEYRPTDYRAPQGQAGYRSDGYRGAPAPYIPVGRRPGGTYGAPPGQRGAPMDDMVDPHDSQFDGAPPRRRVGRVLYALLTAAVVLALAGFGYMYFIRKSPTTKTTVSSSPTALPATDPILSQKTDAKPLTATEVFGHATIRSTATGGGNYTVEKSQAITGCTDVATTKIQALLTSLGCTQAVRANLLSPDGRYTITTGILNMPDQKSASTVRTSIGALVATGKDHFNTYVISDDTAPAPQPTTHLGWDSRGHYVFYVVIGLASGDPISATDTRTPLIISDIVENYLSGTVVGAREKTSTG